MLEQNGLAMEPGEGHVGNVGPHADWFYDAAMNAAGGRVSHETVVNSAAGTSRLDDRAR